MANFDFLNDSKEFAMFAPAVEEAEKVFASSPAMCVIGCRKALELAVKWVYAVDKTIQRPYRDNLSALIHEYTFRKQLVPMLFDKIKNIVDFGNIAVHTNKSVPPGIAMVILKGLFEFIQWIDYSYGKEYQPRQFDEDVQAGTFRQTQQPLEVLHRIIMDLRAADFGSVHPLSGIGQDDPLAYSGVQRQIQQIVVLAGGIGAEPFASDQSGIVFLQAQRRKLLNGNTAQCRRDVSIDHVPIAIHGRDSPVQTDHIVHPMGEPLIQCHGAGLDNLSHITCRFVFPQGGPGFCDFGKGPDLADLFAVFRVLSVF